MPTARRLLPAAAMLVIVLAGCSAAPQRPVEDYSGEPRGVEAPASSAGGASWATWLEDGAQVAIILYGSSTCPPTVQNINATADDTITATLAPAPGGICTHDFVPHTTVFATPSRIASGKAVTVVLPDAKLHLGVR